VLAKSVRSFTDKVFVYQVDLTMDACVTARPK